MSFLVTHRMHDLEAVFIGLCVAIGLGLIPASIAHAKGYDFGLFWVYGILVLIVALPHAITLTPDRRRLDQRKAREGYGHCPYCAELVRKQAIRCPHCHCGPAWH